MTFLAFFYQLCIAKFPGNGRVGACNLFKWDSNDPYPIFDEDRCWTLGRCLCHLHFFIVQEGFWFTKWKVWQWNLSLFAWANHQVLSMFVRLKRDCCCRSISFHVFYMWYPVSTVLRHMGFFFNMEALNLLPKLGPELPWCLMATVFDCPFRNSTYARATEGGSVWHLCRRFHDLKMDSVCLRGYQNIVNLVRGSDRLV